MPYSSEKILVVEDEIIIADDIVRSLRSNNYNTLEPALSYRQAIESIINEKPAIALIDINLAGVKDGIDLATTINEQYHFPFIFLTSNSDSKTVERAKQTKPSAYLLKPFTKQDLYASLEIALHNFYNKEEPNPVAVYDKATFLLIKQGSSFQKLDFDDIVFLRSSHVYVEIITQQKKVFVVRTSLTEYLKKFPLNFARVHRSYAVNTRFIQKITAGEIVLPDEIIPLSKDYRKDLLKNFG